MRSIHPNIIAEEYKPNGSELEVRLCAAIEDFRVRQCATVMTAAGDISTILPIATN
jgi:hypothetical protein